MSNNEAEIRATWEIDWDKIQSWEDIKVLLQHCDIHPKPRHPDFEFVKPLCKLIDMDGRRLDPEKFKVE